MPALYMDPNFVIIVSADVWADTKPSATVNAEWKVKQNYFKFISVSINSSLIYIPWRN